MVNTRAWCLLDAFLSLYEHQESKPSVIAVRESDLQPPSKVNSLYRNQTTKTCKIRVYFEQDRTQTHTHIIKSNKINTLSAEHSKIQGRSQFRDPGLKSGWFAGGSIPKSQFKLKSLLRGANSPLPTPRAGLRSHPPALPFRSRRRTLLRGWRPATQHAARARRSAGC